MNAGQGPAPRRIFELFLELVKIDSESGNEAAVRDYIKAFAEGFGLPVQEDGAGAATGGESGNIVIRVPSGSFSALPPIILNAHMDTVAPGRGVMPVDAGDRFMSAGTTVLGADDKAGVAVILAVVEYLVSTGGGHRALEVVFTIREEQGLLGARNLDYSLVDGSWGLVLDAAGPVGGAVVEAPSRISLEFTVQGRSAHAGIEPEKGINAIRCAAEAIARLELGRLDDRTTANIGVIRGGTASNIVPERVVVEAEIRSLDEGRLEEVREKMVNAFTAAAESNGCQLESAVEESFAFFSLDPGSEHLEVISRAVRDCGLQSELYSTGGGSDANVMNAMGLEMVPLNIGLGNPHSKQEYILKDDLVNVARIVTRIAYLASEEGGGTP